MKTLALIGLVLAARGTVASGSRGPRAPEVVQRKSLVAYFTEDGRPSCSVDLNERVHGRAPDLCRLWLASFVNCGDIDESPEDAGICAAAVLRSGLSVRLRVECPFGPHAHEKVSVHAYSTETGVYLEPFWLVCGR